MIADVWFKETRLDGKDLLERGFRCAGGLIDIGLAEGDVLAVMLRNDPVYVDVVNACRTAGIYYCPINWHFSAQEMRHLLVDSGSKALIIHAGLLAAVRDIVPADVKVLVVADDTGSDVSQETGYEDWLAQQASYSEPKVAPRAHMAYTSGTTGLPKGVLRLPVPLEQLEDQQASMRSVVRQVVGIVPGCRTLMPAPLYHSMPGMFIQNSLQIAERLVIMPSFDAEELLALVEQHRIDVLYLVPIMYVRLLKLPAEVRERYDISSIRFIASTGAPCAPEIKRAMIEWMGPVIYESYSSSETGLITLATPDDAASRPGTAGKPVDAAQLRIMDKAGVPCAPGEVGLVYVHQPAYSDFTYRNNAAARQAMERDGLVAVGDMGYLDEDGYLFICDRASDMVISGGVNIYPAEIEHQLVCYPGVADCVVFGIPDDEYGERLLAMVQPVSGATIVESEVIDWLRQRISGFKIPRSIVIEQQLPRDETGKLAKRRLRDSYWQGRQRRV